MSYFNRIKVPVLLVKEEQESAPLVPNVCAILKSSHKTPVVKFNPYHDKLGRFATSSSGSSPMSGLFQRINEPDSGFTYQPRLRSEPKEGFALSPYPDRSFAKPAAELKLVDLAVYATKNKDLLANDDHYMGAWNDPETGTVYLDISIVAKTPKAAHDLCLKHDQIAYYDLGKGASVTVDRNATSGGVAGGKKNETKT